MKIIKYSFLSCRINHGTEESPEWEDIILPKEIRCTDENLQANEAIAKAEAYNGEYEIVDDGIYTITEPTQLDRVESQVAYLAMMTGYTDILEV
jgi:hypothetical protein